MDPPAVSVVVPTRGRAAYLEVTLDSLLDQHGEVEHEILVVDDGDGGATADAVGARPRVRYVPHGPRRGLNAARNTGLQEAAAPLRTRGFALWRGRPTLAAGAPGPATGGAGASRRSPASCGCWPDAAGTRSGEPALRGWSWAPT